MLRQTILSVVFLAAAQPCFAGKLPFDDADPKAGKALVEQHCISCHASSYGGDGSGIYTQAFTKVEDAHGLVQQVRNCNTNLGLQWFEEDELNAAAFLNKAYYKFTK